MITVLLILSWHKSHNEPVSCVFPHMQQHFPTTRPGNNQIIQTWILQATFNKDYFHDWPPVASWWNSHGDQCFRCTTFPCRIMVLWKTHASTPAHTHTHTYPPACPCPQACTCAHKYTLHMHIYDDHELFSEKWTEFKINQWWRRCNRT